VSPSIDIDDEVFDVLKHNAEPFVDTPNTVLRRMLGIHQNGTQPVGGAFSRPQPPLTAEQPTSNRKRSSKSKQAASSGKSARAARGTLLPESEYELPILLYLSEHGGRAPSREVVEAIGETLADRLTDADRQPLNSGEIRWKSRIAFARLRMVEREELNGEAPRGTWEITDKGRKRVGPSA
jgi:hypothetical protein